MDKKLSASGAKARVPTRDSRPGPRSSYAPDPVMDSAPRSPWSDPFGKS